MIYTILFDNGKISSNWRVLYEGPNYDLALKQYKRRLSPYQRVRALNNGEYISQRIGGTK